MACVDDRQRPTFLPPQPSIHPTWQAAGAGAAASGRAPRRGRPRSSGRRRGRRRHHPAAAAAGRMMPGSGSFFATPARTRSSGEKFGACVLFTFLPFFFPWVGGVGVVPFFNAFLFSWVGVGGWGVVVVLFFMGDGVGGCRWCPCLTRPISTHAHTHTHTTRLQQLRVPPLPRRILPLPALLPQPSDRAHPPPPLPAQHGPLPRHRAAPLAAAGAAAAAAAGGRGGG